jgi:hypothetical protein
MAIWNILWMLGMFYDHWVQFVLIWYIFSRVGIMRQEKSGNPADNQFRKLKRFSLSREHNFERNFACQRHLIDIRT